MLTHYVPDTTVGNLPKYRTMTKSTATLTIQKWGNNLAVRIPAAVARSAHLSVGQPVEVSAEKGGVRVQTLGMPKLSLTQKLARFNPRQHAGEAMATGLIGAEKL